MRTTLLSRQSEATLGGWSSNLKHQKRTTLNFSFHAMMRRITLKYSCFVAFCRSVAGLRYRKRSSLAMMQTDDQMLMAQQCIDNFAPGPASRPQNPFAARMRAHGWANSPRNPEARPGHSSVLGIYPRIRRSTASRSKNSTAARPSISAPFTFAILSSKNIVRFKSVPMPRKQSS